jgi:ribose/xylose/arabinose/galactoside ABC-type transport system permease subunit
MSQSTDTALTRIKGQSEELMFTVLDNLIWPLLLLGLLAFGLLLPEIFLTQQNLVYLLYASAALGAVVLGESLCLLSGNFDLSVGAIVGFSAMATAMALTQWLPGLPGVAGVVLILAIGGFIGLLNGVAVAHFGINPFLQTLAFLIIFNGATIALNTSSIFDLPASYLFIGGEEAFGIPIAVSLVFALYLVAWYCLRHTPFGLAIYAVGGDERAASKAGIDEKKVVLAVFVLSGALCGLGGLILTGFTGAATPALGNNMVFPAYAAAVIGGISLFGGRGNIVGAMAGVLLLGTFEAGLVMMSIDPSVIDMINGIILLFAIFLYTWAERLREEILSEE